MAVMVGVASLGADWARAVRRGDVGSDGAEWPRLEGPKGGLERTYGDRDSDLVKARERMERPEKEGTIRNVRS